MSLPPQAQTLVDQLVQVLGLQAHRPSSLDINMDEAGIVQDIKPRLTFKRGKSLATQPNTCRLDAKVMLATADTHRGRSS